MTINIEIVENSRAWYDPEIANNDPVVYQNVNYNTGNFKSVTVTRHRYLQDWSRRIIPNSIREGVSLSIINTDQVSLGATDGYATVAGRFIRIPADTVLDATTEGLTSSLDYYLVLWVSAITEESSRIPALDTAEIRAIQVTLPYAPTHNELVIGKFHYDGVNVTDLVSYVGEQEWQVNYISPVASKPNGAAGSTQIILRDGLIERENNVSIEPDGTRLYKKLILNDQEVVPTGDTQLINRFQFNELRNHNDTLYSGLGLLNLYIGVDELIDSSSNITTQLGTIKTNTLNAEGDVIVMRDVSETLTNKTITDPIVTDGTFDTPVMTTPKIVESAGSYTYNFIGSDLIADRVVTLPLLISDDTFVFEDHIQTLTNKTLTQPSITDFTNAQHDHADTDDGGTISITAATTGTLPVSRGGTGVTTFSTTENGVVIADGTANLTSAVTNTSGLLLVSQASVPTWQTPTVTLTGDVTGSANMNTSGDWSIATNSYAYSEAVTNTLLGIGTANDFWCATSFEGFDPSVGTVVAVLNSDFAVSSSIDHQGDLGWVYSVTVPALLGASAKGALVSGVRVVLNNMDTGSSTLNSIKILRVDSDGGYTTIKDITSINRTTTGTYTTTFAAVDTYGGGYGIKVAVYISDVNSIATAISSVQLEMYYE